MPTDPARLSEEQLVLLFVRLRDAGQAQRALEAWRMLAIKSRIRVKAIVAAFTFEGGAPLARHLREDAEQEAFLRLMAMAANFSGSSAGEFAGARVTCVQNTIRDLARKDFRHERRAAGSLDAGHADDPGAEGSPFEAAIARMSRERQAAANEDREQDEALERAGELVRWGIAQIPNEGYRAVLELTYRAGLSGEAIAERLHISPDNVYQRRRRGLLKLEEILRDAGP